MAYWGCTADHEIVFGDPGFDESTIQRVDEMGGYLLNTEDGTHAHESPAYIAARQSNGDVEQA